jgi:hypothetical protein
MATEPDKVDSGVLGTLAVVLAFGLVATGLAITALVRTEADELHAERSGTNEALAEMRGAQEADLNLPPAYMDQQAGVVRLPIDRAMQVVVRDLRKNPESATAPKPAAHTNGDAAGEGAALPAGTEAADEAAGKQAAEGSKGEGAAEGDAGDDGTGVKAPGKPPAPPKPKAPPAPKAPTAPKPAAPTAPVPAPVPAPAPAAP